MHSVNQISLPTTGNPDDPSGNLTSSVTTTDIDGYWLALIHIGKLLGRGSLWYTVVVPIIYFKTVIPLQAYYIFIIDIGSNGSFN